MTEEQKLVCLMAINHYGVDCQVSKALEEMGELIVELSRRGTARCALDKIADEVADVTIMMEQLRVICGCARVDGHIQGKIERLGKRLDGGHGSVVGS